MSWGPYQTFRQLVTEDPRCSPANPMFAEVEQPGIGTYLMPGSPLDFSNVPRVPVRRAPQLGEHTEEVLAGVLGLSGAEIGRLHDGGVVAGAAGARAHMSARGIFPHRWRRELHDRQCASTRPLGRSSPGTGSKASPVRAAWASSTGRPTSSSGARSRSS